MKGEPKYFIYICLLEAPCPYKRQDKKSKLPICYAHKPYDKPVFTCNNRYKTSCHDIGINKPTIQEIRLRRLQDW